MLDATEDAFIPADPLEAEVGGQRRKFSFCLGLGGLQLDPVPNTFLGRLVDGRNHSLDAQGHARELLVSAV